MLDGKEGDNVQGVGIGCCTILRIRDLDADLADSYYNIPLKNRYYQGIALNLPKFDLKKECHRILQNEHGDAPEKAKVKYKNTFRFYHDVANIP